MRRPLATIALLACPAAAAAGPAAAADAAAETSAPVTLRYTPTGDVVLGARPMFVGVMAERAVALRAEDGRSGEKTIIGSRAAGRGKKVQLTIQEPVADYVALIATQLARSWDVKIDPEASLVLTVTLLQLDVTEGDPAMGRATYVGNVVLGGELTDRNGEILWRARGAGDASHRAGKHSNEDVNQAQSNALQKALARLLSDPALQTAWVGRPRPKAASPQAQASGKVAAPASAPAPAQGPLTPQQMLKELEPMATAGVAPDGLVTKSGKNGELRHCTRQRKD